MRLGAWKVEEEFRRAKFIRQKTYLEDIWNEKEQKWEIKITCAGLPERCYDQVTWDNFKEGLKVKPGTKIIPFSATSKQGREEIWELIESLKE